jgi:hypothetical protein
MMRTLLLLIVVGVAACGANQSQRVASTEEATLFRGQKCVRDAQCMTLNCVNNECRRREP